MAQKLGDFAKSISSKKETTPLQENKNGVLSLPENKLHQLKQLALDKKKSVRNLINTAIDKEYFNS